MNKQIQKILNYQKQIYILESSINSLSKQKVTTTDLLLNILKLKKQISKLTLTLNEEKIQNNDRK